jgi:hypothetical protein
MKRASSPIVKACRLDNRHESMGARHPRTSRRPFMPSSGGKLVAQTFFARSAAHAACRRTETPAWAEVSFSVISTPLRLIPSSWSGHPKLVVPRPRSLIHLQR